MVNHGIQAIKEKKKESLLENARDGGYEKEGW
jgi:hypothetical protein